MDVDTRAAGALAGLLIGDALAMPVHWYYDRDALAREYGRVTDYLAPKTPHSGSIMWRSSYRAPNQKGEILHDQAQYYGRHGVHYHQFLKAGENTLTGKLARLTLKVAAQGYSAERYLAEYIAYLRTPGTHGDTYLEECHRGFFTNYANGVEPARCAIKEKHIGGLTPMLALALAFRHQPEEGLEKALQHMRLTHAGERMRAAGQLIVEILYEVLAGAGLSQALERRWNGDDFLRHPYAAWARLPDERVIGPKVSPACYVDDSIPAVLHLATKYHDQPEEALIANTNIGGENVHRGSVLGCLLGAEHGPQGWPDRWLEGLQEPVPAL